jgi:tetratricopeptide (TPR) repeat protein
MLKSLKRSREQKATLKAEESINKGIAQVKGKLFKQAMIEFQNAYQLDPKTVLVKLEREFAHFLEIRDHEAALSIGLVLIRIKQTDYELVNTVANCARKLKDYKQANNLYRHALRINKNFSTAFFNLAASMGKVEKFDSDVKRSLQILADIKGYILPEYYADPDFEVRTAKAFLNAAAERRDQKRRALERQIADKEHQNEKQEADALRMELAELQRQGEEDSDESEYLAFIEDIVNSQTENSATTATENSPTTEPNSVQDLYNFGLFALKRRKTNAAMRCFEKCKELQCPYKYLDMLIAITMAVSGQVKEAVQFFVDYLGKDQYNRFFNINLGFMYKALGNRLLATKYLAIGAELLEKSEGLYHISDLISIADEAAARENHKKALKLYKIAVAETEDADLWAKIGEIYVEQKRYEEATQAFREIQRIEPQSELAERRLTELHDIFSARAEGFYNDAKFQAAASNYEKALRILRKPETIKQAAAVHKILNNTTRMQSLNDEYEEILKKEREAENEKKRREYIKMGRAYIKRKNFRLGIEYLEMAFRMKLDKDVFMLLAAVYKSLNRRESIQDLLSRWNKMVEYEDKLKKFRKDDERSLPSGV